MMNLDGVLVNVSGDPILPEKSDREMRGKFFELLADEEGIRNVEDHEDEIEAYVNRPHIACRFADPSAITLAEYASVVRMMFAACAFQSMQPDEPVVDVRPRNENGRFKGEYQIFYEQSDTRAIRERRSRDIKFDDWVRKEVEAQWAASTAESAPAPVAPQAQAEESVVRDFADAYNRAPAAAMRMRNGRITLDDRHSYTRERFDELLALASQFGLVR